MTVSSRLRHSRNNPCGICGGWDDARLRGRGQRCFGFDSDDGKYVYCTREEHAGTLPFKDGAQAYCHIAQGECRCGAEHAPSLVTLPSQPLPHARHQRHGAARLEGTIECYYVYFGPDDKPLHRTVRFKDPKEFRQQRYDRGSWRWGLADTKTVLYRLPQLASAPDNSLVFLCEGERDADRLTALGLIATCAPGGCSWKEHYVDYLSRFDIAIVADNDDAGKLRAAHLSRALLPKVRSVCVHSFDSMPKGSDISDWLDAGGTADELVAASREAGVSVSRVA